MALQRLDEARQSIQQSLAKKMDDFTFHLPLYTMAFLAADAKGMEQEQKWFEAHPDDADFGLGTASDTEAYGGRLVKARELSKKAVDSAVRADAKENGGVWLENNAIAEAPFGNPAQARQQAAEGIKLAPDSQAINVEAALAYAIAGDTTRAETMVKDLNGKYPLDTQMQALWLPAIQGQIALNQQKSAACRSKRCRKPAGDLEYGSDSVPRQYLLSVSHRSSAAKRISPPTKAKKPPPNSRKSSTTPASSGTAGPARSPTSA